MGQGASQYGQGAAPSEIDLAGTLGWCLEELEEGFTSAAR